MMRRNVRYHGAMYKPSDPQKQRLKEAALAYLERFESSRRSVELVLRRRIQRWQAKEMLVEEEAAQLGALIPEILAELIAAGLLDDRRYAETKSASLSRSGRSRRAIGGYLAAKGIAADVIGDVFKKAAEDAVGDPDLAAALRFAQKKRIGRFRPAEDRAEKRQRDLAVLGRAGFSYAIAAEIVDFDS